MSTPEWRPSASRPVLVGNYRSTADGRLRTRLPSACPRANHERPCRVVVSHHRHPSTDPKHPLLVARCRTHAIAFTVYPPGHVPYARAPLVQLAPDGGQIQRELGTPQAETFRGTLFEAAVDAAAGHPWARPDFDEQGPWWNTQMRHLDVIERLLGLSPEQPESLREQIATALGVALLDLRCGAKAIADRPGYRTSGTAALSVLELMAGARCLIERLMLGAHRAGLWGVPFFFDDSTASLRSPALPVHARRAPPRKR